MTAPFLFRVYGTKKTLLSCVGALAVLAAGFDAHAQVKDRQDQRRQETGAKVTMLQDPDKHDHGENDANMLSDSFQAKGVELGQFLFLPKIEVVEQFNANVYATHADRKKDYITSFRPEAKFRSRFIEHELNLGFLVEDYRYATYTDDNRTDFTTNLDGRYDFSSDTQATQFSQIAFQHEDRGSPDAVNGVEPTKTFTSTNRTGLQHKAGRYKFVGEAGYDRKEFGDAVTSAGVTTSNGDRDRWEFQLRQRGSYEMFPGYAVLAEVSENVHRFDLSNDRNGYDRNSSGYRAETGVGVDISKLIRGDFLIGYLQQNYDDDRLKGPRGLAMRASFNWTPTKLTSVIPTVERSISDTTTARASAMVHNSANLTVKHELARNIILTGFGGVSLDEPKGVSNQNFWTYEAGFNSIYSFMPELYVSGEVKYRDKEADTKESSFSQTVIMVRLGVQY